MAEQENKELSMAEILASIRKILEESGADEALRRKEAEEEVFELQPSMIVREEPAPAAKPEIPSAVPGRLISEARKTRVADEETAEYFAGANRHFAAAEEFSAAGADGFSLPGVIVGRPEEKAAAVRAEEKNTPAEETVLPPAVSAAEPDEREKAAPAGREETSSADVSEEIISSFTRMFEQNDFRRRAEQPAFDADALLRGIARQAVAEKLDNRMLQETVRETVIPVLEEWLSHYLPKLVAEEVKRVMVKAGGR